VAVSGMAGQVPSHAPTGAVKQAAPAASPFQVSDKPVARVNGSVLTDRDLLREMLQIFPYARQHNGFPKAEEAAIRQGALQMIIFEELVYQEAQRRKLAVPPGQLQQAEINFKKQFNSAGEYQEFLKEEMGESDATVREKIRRALLIEEVLKIEVEKKSGVSEAELRAYYEGNPAKFEVPETFAFQTISILPPQNPNPDQIREGQKRVNEALRQAKATKSYQEFGLFAEKISEDDFHVNMGDHKDVGRDKLPPQVVKALLAMKPGQVSDVIQIDQAYTIVRLRAHSPARRQSLAEVRSGLAGELQKKKYEQQRIGLDKQLRAKAKVEVL
jgi:parvulin-like peptidyl-prolyl isomerase